jgi:hypothetical protein
MHKITVVIIFLAFFEANGQQKLTLNIDVGNGKPLQNSNYVTGFSSDHTISFDKVLMRKVGNRLITNPQYTIALGYVHKKAELAIGLEKGRTELSTKIIRQANAKFISSISVSANTNQWSLWVSRQLFTNSAKYTVHKNPLRIKIIGGIGFSYVTHEFNNYQAGDATRVTKDTTNKTSDSLINVTTSLTNHGYAISPRFRFSIYRAQWRFHPEIVCSYHFGLVNLWQSQRIYYFDNLMKSFATNSISNGSQFKIAIMIPIKLHAFK